MPTIVQLNPVSGKFGFVQVGDFVLPLATWNAVFQADYLPADNFNRYPYGLTGIEGGEVTIGGRKHVATTVGSSYSRPPINLRVGQRVQVILGFTPVFYLPSFELLITRVNPKNNVREAADWECSGQAQGTTTPLDIPWYPNGPYTSTYPPAV